MRTTRVFLALLITLVLAVPLGAQTPDPPLGTIVTSPRVPYAGQPIAIAFTDFCPHTDTPTVERNGNSIRVISSSAPCSPPIAQRITIPIGTLPAGIYSVAVHGHPDEPPTASGEFQVLAPGEQSFSVHPSAVPAGLTTAPLEVVLTTNTQYLLCPNGECAVRVGGQVAQKRLDSRGNVLVTPPPTLAPGAYDITIDSILGHIAVPGALYLWDPAAAPDFAYFERILFPVLFNAPGANGSLWRTETVISNPEPWTLETYNDISPLVCIDYPCAERFAPASKLRFDGGNYPRGVALIVPRREADTLAFALRARDVSRVAETYGTEIPVVREADMYRDVAITLPDVPVDPRYRVRVRVYAFDAVDGAPGTINGHDPGRRTKTVQPFTLTRSCSGVRQCAAVPWSAEVDLFAGEAGERRNLYVNVPEGTTAWAFATVTNNKTQEVTIVRPSGTGGEPCLPCLIP